MLSFQQFSNMMQRSAGESREGVTVALRSVVGSVAIEAKGYIGHEMPTWPPLAPSTVAEKTKLGYVGRMSATDPLLRTGNMRASISFYAVGSVGVVGGNKIALWQEMGTLRPTGSIPPRPFIGLAASRSRPQLELFFGQLAVSLLAPKGAR